MTPERWKRTEELYHAASARPPGDRAAFLAAACADDETLRRDVESLLQAPVDAGFLAGPALLAASQMADAFAPAPMTGRSLGAYRLESLLGAGGMGEVYRARDAKLGRDVAIKILPRAFTSDPDRLARFEREARLLAALNHPNICAIYGLEETDPSAGSGQAAVRFLILELIEGPTLADRIAGRASAPPMPLAETLRVARQIAGALEVAHEKGIIHRDLKPANIKITPDGVVKVLDFGLAKTVTSDGATPDLTQASDIRRDGVLIGTASYMSPEQARGLTVDKRTDIWAFGCVLYQMLTGRVPFPGDTISDTIAKILEREPDWSALPATTPASVRRLLVRCLAKDQKQRLRDIGDVRIELDAVDDGPAGTPQWSRSASVGSLPTWAPWIALAAIIAGVTVREIARAPAPSGNLLANAQFTLFTDWEGTEGSAEISPDGRFVAFAADRSGEFDIWLKQVGVGDFTNLTASTAPVGAPHQLLRTFGFSGDGAEIWFSLAGDPIVERKMLMPLTGGAARPFLAECEATPAWSSNAARLVYFRGRCPGERTSGDPLFVADRTGGDAQQMLARETDVHNHNPVWSPDDRWLYYVHGFVRGLNWTDEVDIWRLPAAGGSPERLTQQKTAVTFLAPIDARTLLYVARGQDGSGPWLWTVDTQTRVTTRVSSGLEQYTSVAASRDGRRVVATRANPVANLWRAPILDRLAEDRDVQPYEVKTARALAPRFAGTSLFYLSSHGTADGLWRFRDGEAFEVRKGTDGALFEPPAVSRDGRRVAVVLAREGRRRLAIMSADGTGLRGLADSIDIEGAADWSPDGAWIVAGGSDDTHGPALFKIPVEGGPPIALVAGHAVNPAWSPDGSLIVYSGALVPGQVTPLLGVRPDGGAVALPAVRVRSGGYRFLPDGRGLVHLPNNRSLDFWLADLATGHRRQLTQFTNRGDLRTFDITPDGKHIVFDRARQNSDIVLIDLPAAR